MLVRLLTGKGFDHFILIVSSAADCSLEGEMGSYKVDQALSSFHLSLYFSYALQLTNREREYLPTAYLRKFMLKSNANCVHFQ